MSHPPKDHEPGSHVPPEPAPGTAPRVVGTTEDAPGASHREPHAAPPPAPERISGILAATQFVFTGVILAVVASLMYMAGLNSGHGGGGGGEGAPPGQAAATVDVQALMASTPEQVASGKNIYSINCASCHGTVGKGDGPAAAALNPKPRDFSSGYWRYGGGVARIVQTITNGSPGTAMAPFPGIPLADRFALAHYVRTLAPKQDADKPEDLAWLDQFGGGAKQSDSAGTAAAGGVAAAGPSIPIARAMALLAEAAPPPVRIAAVAADSSEGALLYQRRCASCHGLSGEGGVRTRMLGSAPYAYLTTRSLGAPSALTGDAGGFERLVLHGLPGRMMPGNGDLSSEQIRALYSYTQTLRARLEGASRARS